MFRFLGKVIVGLLAFVGTVVLVIVGAAWVLAPHFMPARESLPGSFVLTVDLDQPVLEGEGGGWFGSSDGKAVSLRTLLDALERAAADDRVKGLVAHIGTPRMGMAQAQEVREAVHAFRANGKPTYVYAETMPAGGGKGTLAYYMASAFGEIWMQPSGEVGLVGVAMESPFFAQALTDVGLAFEASSRHEYKGVLAGFTENSMPQAQEENLRRLVASWFDQMKAGISAARTIQLDALDSMIDRAPLLVTEAVETGLVDKAGYRDQFRDAVREALGEQDRLTVGSYMARRDDSQPETARRIALIHGTGMVVSGGGDGLSPFGQANVLRAQDLADAIDLAVNDERVAAIVLRLNSPGGDYVASDTARRALERAREAGTPVIVSMGNMAASGGYFIALEGDRILASPGTVTGSIGVAAGKLVARRLWDDLGVTWTRIAEGGNAAMWSMNSPFSVAARRALDNRLDAIYADFTDRVGAARNMEGERLNLAARGRVFTGADALSMGLVDQLGGLREAIQAARQAAALAPDEMVAVVPYPKPEDPLKMLLRLLDDPSALPGMARTLAGVPDADLRALGRLAVVLGPVLEPLMRALPSGDVSSEAVELRYMGPVAPNVRGHDIQP